MYFEKSMTTATLQHWPARLVPPPRERIGAPCAGRRATVATTSSTSAGARRRSAPGGSSSRRSRRARGCRRRSGPRPRPTAREIVLESRPRVLVAVGGARARTGSAGTLVGRRDTVRSARFSSRPARLGDQVGRSRSRARGRRRRAAARSGRGRGILEVAQRSHARSTVCGIAGRNARRGRGDAPSRAHRRAGSPVIPPQRVTSAWSSRPRRAGIRKYGSVVAVLACGDVDARRARSRTAAGPRGRRRTRVPRTRSRLLGERRGRAAPARRARAVRIDHSSCRRRSPRGRARRALIRSGSRPSFIFTAGSRCSTQPPSCSASRVREYEQKPPCRRSARVARRARGA